MQGDTFDGLLTELEALTAEQRQAVLERLKVLGERDDSARLIAERLSERVICAHCGHSKVQRFGYTRVGHATGGVKMAENGRFKNGD